MKAQGSLEYLLIIGGGIILAVIIIGAIIPLSNTGSGANQQLFADGQCRATPIERCNIAPPITFGEEQYICQFDYDAEKCIAKKVDVLLDHCTEGTGWEAGKVYLLSAEINESLIVTCFTINQPNITFSCGGKNLTSFTQAIQLSNENITIQNCNISAGLRGIVITTGATNNIKILYNQITIRDGVGPSNGIALNTGTAHRVEGNTITFLATLSGGTARAIKVATTVSDAVIKNNASCDTILPSLIDILGANLPQNSESGGNTCTAGKCLENFMGDPVVCSEGDGIASNCNKSC